MKFEFISNACGIFHGSLGTKILCDPWIKDGVFEGSWYHFPPLRTQTKDLLKVDCIYISHLHPDHFDSRTFTQFNKSIPIVILDRSPNYLEKSLKNLGFNNLIKIKDKNFFNFREFKITVFKPFVKHNFEDSDLGNLIDSSILLEDNGIVAINFNDNTPSLNYAKKIKKKFKKIDLVLINYNAAGPYPSCFDNLSKKKKLLEHKRIINRNFHHTLNIIKILKPRAAKPFAGSYILGGKESKKNNYLGNTTQDECLEFLNKKLQSNTHLFCLNEKQVFDIKKCKVIRLYKKINLRDKKNYIKKISKIKYEFQYDNKPNHHKLISDILLAKDNLNNKIKKLDINLKTNIFLKINKEKIQLCKSKFNNKLICKLDLRLLRRILDKKSHWNNAEIGGHISFFRKPNKMDVDTHTCLSFFHL